MRKEIESMAYDNKCGENVPSYAWMMEDITRKRE
jgi:hypothetical protein